MALSGVSEKQDQVAPPARLTLRVKLSKKAEKSRKIKERNYSYMVVMEEFANVIPMEMTQCLLKVKLCPI